MSPTPDKIMWWAGEVYLQREEVLEVMDKLQFVFFYFPGIWNSGGELLPGDIMEVKCVIPTQTITLLCLHYKVVAWSLNPLVTVN